jgi:DNA-binding transcriptional MocR family regulator
MAAPARQRLLEVAARHRLPVVEDGFDGTLFYAERPPAPLKALDRTGLVVYIGTFSKILFPGLRLGWIVAGRAVDRLEIRTATSTPARCCRRRCFTSPAA